MGKKLRIGLMLASVALACRSFWYAYIQIFQLEAILKQEFQLEKVAPHIIAGGVGEALWDFAAGTFLLLWPFYLGWLQERRRQ